MRSRLWPKPGRIALAALAWLTLSACGQSDPREQAKPGIGRTVGASASAFGTAQREEEQRVRTEMLASGRRAQLEAVIERWPASPEAAEAKRRLARVVSLCADVELYATDLRQQAEGFEKLAERADATRKTTDRGARLDGYEALGKELASLGPKLKNNGLEVEQHAVQPGEERLRTVLHDAFWVLADLASELGEKLDKPAIESDESYDQHASRAVAAFVTAAKKGAEKVRKDVDAATATCGETATR